jgi:hypothetical protein
MEVMEKPVRTAPQDQRVFLKIKLASLVAEARIIRKRERQAKDDLRNQLRNHRVGIVRSASRSTGIALGLIRGRTLEQMEPSRKTEPNWTEILKMLKRYGPTGMAAELEAKLKK